MNASVFASRDKPEIVTIHSADVTVQTSLNCYPPISYTDPVFCRLSGWLHFWSFSLYPYPVPVYEGKQACITFPFAPGWQVLPFSLYKQEAGVQNPFHSRTGRTVFHKAVVWPRHLPAPGGVYEEFGNANIKIPVSGFPVPAGIFSPVSGYLSPSSQSIFKPNDILI